MSSEVAIKVENLSKCYRIYDRPRDRLLQMITRGRKQYGHDFWALKDVSFEIKKGETVGIIGRNGSGKSTLLQMICGTLNPTSGKIETNGRVAALLELGSGFNPEFTGRENVYMNATVLGLQQEEIRSRFDDIAAFADIGEHLEQPVKTYSSGMMLRLAFAVIAHVDADILVIDEALAVGDAFFTQKCMRFLREFMKAGTILFVSHDTSSVKSLCNHAIWIEKGEIKKLGSPKDVCELYLEAFYEAQQGKNSIKKHQDMKRPSTELFVKDQRSDFINSTNLRNDIEVFKFNANAASFGKGGILIKSVKLMDDQDRVLSWIVGGEFVVLEIESLVIEKATSPIVGFMVKDYRGEILFAKNTYLTYINNPLSISPGHNLLARFKFIMPVLPSGNYMIAVSVADGTQEEHIQHHWIHDALAFQAHSSSICHGLIGIPMLNIEMREL